MTSPNPAKVIIPSEVGWQFVPQYYTYVNKQPSRLHCFYTKNSTFIHGTEGEDGKPCYGQHEIHEKILSIGFQDCKVFIHSVDAQSSANNGIIIQVIGEMSNNGEPWRKFAQTFFLAEQPNGYFVLNDIFRFLKEESSEDVEEQVSEGVAEEEAVSESAPVVDVTYHPTPQQESHAEPPPATDPLLPPIPTHVEASPSLPDSVVNGVNGHGEEAPATPEPETVALEPVEPAPEPAELTVTIAQPPATPPRAISPVQAPAVALESPVPATIEKPVEVPPTPAVPVPTTIVLETPPAPPKPAAPKTWATLAASKSGSWGSALAAEAKGVSAAAPSTPLAQSSRPASIPRSQNASGAITPVERNVHPLVVAASAVTIPQCFVKGVDDKVDRTLMEDILIARFGPLKDAEFVPTKACAFLEFATVEAARRAIIASLPINVGGEGGIRIAEGDPESLKGNRNLPRIIVETRKERPDRPAARNNRGAPNGPPFRGGPGRGRGGPRGGPPAPNPK